MELRRSPGLIGCRCRKPDVGLFLMAEKFYQVDKAHSWMIGDKLIDVEAGRNYGVRTVLAGTGYGAGFHAKLQEGYDDLRAGKVQNAASAFKKFRESNQV